VVLPDAANLLLDMGVYPRRAGAALRDAVEHLRSREVLIDKIAVVGHSLGGAATLRLAADWKKLTSVGDNPGLPDLPKPSALVLLEGGGATDGILAILSGLSLAGTPKGEDQESWLVTPEALSSIPCTTRLLIIEAEASAQPKPGGHFFWTNLRQIAKFTRAAGTASPVPQRCPHGYRAVIDSRGSHSCAEAIVRRVQWWQG
jgi:pimeloyl-ACP methyl ester carboxylesterase